MSQENAPNEPKIREYKNDCMEIVERKDKSGTFIMTFKPGAFGGSGESDPFTVSAMRLIKRFIDDKQPRERRRLIADFNGVEQVQDSALAGLIVAKLRDVSQTLNRKDDNMLIIAGASGKFLEAIDDHRLNLICDIAISPNMSMTIDDIVHNKSYGRRA